MILLIFLCLWPPNLAFFIFLEYYSLINSPIGIHSEWKVFLNSLNLPFEFLHEDEYKKHYKTEVKSTPLILSKRAESLEVLVSTELINQCKTTDDLKQLILSKLNVHHFTN